jgi:replication fork clamp-binding protein CrfC
MAETRKNVTTSFKLSPSLPFTPLLYRRTHVSFRVYKTSGLLGFHGSQLKQTSGRDRFGLDSLFTEGVKELSEEEETPQFVSEFNNYCANSTKLKRTHFKVSVNSYETPNENYVRILSEWGTPLIEQLIADSGIEEFRHAITRYSAFEVREVH